MWAKDKNEIGQVSEKRERLWSTSLRKSSGIVLITFRYSFLVAFLVLLASHEAGNPKFGRTTVEFYKEEFRQRISQELDNDYISGYDLDETSLASQFYSLRGYFPAWTINFETNAHYRELIELVGTVYHYGLLPSNYFFKELKAYEQQLKAEGPESQKMVVRIKMEKTATRASIRLMKHLAVGIRENDTTAMYQAFIQSIPHYLQDRMETGNLRSGIISVQPENPQYVRLQRALSHYLSRAMDDTLVYKPEDLMKDRNRVIYRLAKQGYLDESFMSDSTAITSAIRNFQRTHSLDVTGELDTRTLDAMCKGTKDRFYKIALNLDRIRKDELSAKNSILVNIPEFRLHYYDADGKETEFNVIVGKTSSPTPLIQSKLERIITNPYWTVPKSITRNEIIPLIRKDSLYLQKHGFTVIDNQENEVDMNTIDWQNLNAAEFKYWIRQTRVNNALGVVKFLFPNNYSVYLHDTPSKRLFSRRVRAYSHGCIRVQDPQNLAQMLVDNYAEQQEDIKTLIRSREQKEISIRDSVSLYIRYYSCTADSAGILYFHPDIYSRDNAAIQELFANSSWN